MDKKGSCKSAPVGGRKNSIKRDMSTTSKEINNWIHKGNKDGEMQRKASRNFSLLAENVTEERMLYARQLELGRERYKFLSNHDYEKHKFLERQNNKEKMMKKFMSSARKVIEKAHSEKPRKILTVRIPQADETSPPATPTEEAIAPRVQSSNSRAGSKLKKRPNCDIPPINTRNSQPSPMLKKHSVRQTTKVEKRDTSHPRKLGVLRSAPSNIHDKDRSKTPSNSVEFKSKPSSDSRGFYVNTSNLTPRGSTETTNGNANKLPEVYAPYNGCMYSVGMPQKFTSSNPTRSVRYKEHPAPIASITRSNTFSGPVSASWLNSPTVRKYGEIFDTSVGDPRYVALTSSLGDIQYPKASIRDIIAGNQVLSSASKSEGAANAKKMHAKFIALILENEFK